MKLSLRYKITAINLIVLVFVFAGISVLVLERLSSINISMVVENLKTQAETSVGYIRQSLLIGTANSDIESAFTGRSKDFAAKLSGEYNVRVLLFSKTGRLLADSEDAGNPGSFQELPEVLKGNRTYVIRSHGGSRFLYFSFPFVQREVVGGLMFVYPLEEIDKITANIQVFLLVSFIGGIVVILLTSILLSFRITRPILQLRDSAIKIAGGSFGDKIPVASSDETGQLAAAFNQMSLELENRINLINFERAKLDSILESMGEGVIALSEENLILAQNDATKKVMTPQLQNEILKISGEVRKLNSPYITELSGKSGSLLVCATPLKQAYSSGGVVLILNDITQLRELQEKQRQFVTNVSHELKTPLTTILGYIDLLKEKGGNKEIFETSVNYLESAGDRLLRLVNDLIDLSALSKWEFEIEPRSTNLSELVEDIVGQMSLKAKKFGIAVEKDLPASVWVNLDPARMKQVVVNILDNAIKYSQQGKILLTLSDRETEVLLSVKDTGCGIPEDVLLHVFEPFYRADRARARSMGGNGLGLAIAKEIIEKHGGSITIKSTAGEGTEVIIRLPRSTRREEA